MAGLVFVPLIIMYAGNALLLVPDITTVILSVFFSLIGMIAVIAMQPAIINAIHSISNGSSSGTITLKSQYAVGFRYFWAVVFVAVLQAVILTGSVMFFVLPAIIISIFSSMYLFVLVIEDKRGFSAFTESYTLVAGRWWGVFGRILFLGIFNSIGYIIVAGLVLIIETIIGIDSKTVLSSLINLVFHLGLSLVLVPVSMIYIYGLYRSLKETRLADVSTVWFKRWLVVFVIIGVLGIIALVGMSGGFLLSS